ncbi:MAG: hypothetical protein ACOY40_14745 [Bacillota bacterium]
MKRKLAVVISAVFILAATASIGFAATDNNQDYFTWMFNAQRQWVKQAVESKQLTPEQGQVWNNHFDQMQKFHSENGFICPGPGMMGGFGWGMMGGYPNRT